MSLSQESGENERDGNLAGLEIYVMDADGENPVRLTRDPGSDGAPCWSPDGTRIAFHTDRDGNTEIYVMDADGENLTNLTQHPMADQVASWSPGQLAVSPKARLLTLWGKIKTTQGDER